jgi:hypothetical protein
MNHFVGWGFFSRTVSANPARLEGPILMNWKTRLVQGIFLLILESGWNSWGFLLGPFESPPESSAAMKLLRTPGTFKDPANPSISAAEEIAQSPPKLPDNKSSGKIALTIEHFHDSSKQKRAIKNFRFVVHFSSSEFKIGCQVLFSDLMHYSQNSR